MRKRFDEFFFYVINKENQSLLVDIKERNRYMSLKTSRKTFSHIESFLCIEWMCDGRYILIH